ncbi:hypothetical protein EV644_116118 [Kribbella orskensis]|uniref:Uncharacterized protein n=1 Tax=Kribbella orskensis TaxID=2512216 RepID=A0ABY2BCZ2_9ACTN|nr:hypothetical protein EV642_117119 [Kribbella sp. VKM Ac-2500]TCO16746.1 hypothetical protein EV644_116118 [Kribbella orskensis]
MVRSYADPVEGASRVGVVLSGWGVPSDRQYWGGRGGSRRGWRVGGDGCGDCSLSFRTPAAPGGGFRPRGVRRFGVGAGGLFDHRRLFAGWRVVRRLVARFGVHWMVLRRLAACKTPAVEHPVIGRPIVGLGPRTACGGGDRGHLRGGVTAGWRCGVRGPPSAPVERAERPGICSGGAPGAGLGWPAGPFRAKEGLAGFCAHELADGMDQQRSVGHHDPGSLRHMVSWRRAAGARILDAWVVSGVRSRR